MFVITLQKQSNYYKVTFVNIFRIYTSEDGEMSFFRKLDMLTFFS